jgi:threonine/homoserine/homoserine lactone efflux protein
MMEIFLTAGLILGLSAGFSPGPLTTLVISQTLQYGAKEGIKVSLAPFITDAPIVVLSVFVLAKLSNFDSLLGVISIGGGFFLIHLAWQSFKTGKINVEDAARDPRSLGKGVMVNFLSPNPYLFWISVGAPTTVDAWSRSGLKAVGFLAVFYICLVGGKMTIAIIAHRSKSLLTGAGYNIVMNILGALLLVFALFLFREGFKYLGLINI